MKINGVEIEFSIWNPEDAGKIDTAYEKLEAERKAISKKKLSLRENMESTIDVCRNFLKDVTGTDVLKGCKDALTAVQAVAKFMKEVAKQKKALTSPLDIENFE